MFAWGTILLAVTRVGKCTGTDRDELEAAEMDSYDARTPPSLVRQKRNELRRKYADLQALEATGVGTARTPSLTRTRA